MSTSRMTTTLRGGLRHMPHVSLLALTLSWPKIRAMDDGFGNWAVFGDELLVEEDNEASAPTMPPLAPPTAVLSPHHCPKPYVDVVLTTMGGELSSDIPYFSTGSSTIACRQRQTPDSTPTQPTLSSCWPTTWPPGSQSTGAPSLQAATSAPRSQPIY